MPIVSHVHPFVVGVDTHARSNALAIITSAGELIAAEQFPTTPAAMARATAWVRRRTGNADSVLWVIEWIATYGAGIARIAGTEFKVVEAPRMSARANNSFGKSDPLDARRIAAAALPIEVADLRIPRQDEGARAATRVVLTGRNMMTTERTNAVNALTALLRSTNLGVDARRPLTTEQIKAIARWRRREEDIALVYARSEAVRLATRIAQLDQQLVSYLTELTTLLHKSPAAALLAEYGIGPVVAGTIFAA